MRKTENQILNEKLAKFSEECDRFIEIIHSMEIFNLNFEIYQEAIIDKNSSDWKIFCNNLSALIQKYKDNMCFERLISIYHKVKCYPNSNNINDLKVEIHSLLNSFEQISEDSSENDIWSFIHPKIVEISKCRFIDGYYADAVETAFKEINSRVKHLYQLKTGEERDGADLMRKAFSPNNPILIFEDLNSQSGKNVQQGYMDIFAGAMTGIRNPKAHENMTISALQAVQRLMFASLLMYKIDEAVKFGNIEE